MPQVITDMLTSKKFLAAVLSIAVYVAGKFGLHWTETDLEATVGPLWLYIAGQALADHGSTAAAVTAAKPVPPVVAAGTITTLPGAS